jgi:O-antigen/teichoic acid export membrane protein
MKVGAAFIQTLASQLFQSVASVATGVLIARGLGPAGQGRYATFAAGIALGALIASIGQFHGNVLAGADRETAPRVLLARALLHGCLVLAALSSTLLLWRDLVAPGRHVALAFLFALVLSLEAIALMVRGINLGQHHVTGWNVASLTQRFCYFIAVGILALSSRLQLGSVVACWALATFASVAVSAGWVWFHSDRAFSLGAIVAGWGRRLAQGMRAFITIAFTLLLVRADVWMLGPMLGVASVGQISVATYLAEWLWYVPSILGNLLFAVVAADRSARSVHQVARSARLVTSMLVPLTVTLLLSGRALVNVMYGAAYQEAGVLFTLLLPGIAALGIHLIVDSFFAGSGFPPITIWGAIGAVAAKFSLNLLVVPKWGVAGAAGVTSVVYIGLLILKVAGFVRVTGLKALDLVLPNRSDFAYVMHRVEDLVGSVKVR